MTPPEKNAGRKKAALIVVLVVAVAAAASIAGYRWYRNTHISTDDAFVDGRIHMVSARVPGTVAAVLVRDDEKVSAGQILIRIDREPYDMRERGAKATRDAAQGDVEAARAEIEAARADLAAAVSDLAAAKARMTEVEASVGASKSRLALSEARLLQAGRDFDRAKSIFDRQALSRDRFEKAETEKTIAASQVDADREQVRLSEASIATQRAVIAQREAAVVQRKAAISAREARLSTQGSSLRKQDASVAEASLQTRYTDIVSPSDGYITRKSVEPGQVVSAGQPLLAVAALGDVWIVANYKETQIEKIRPGQAVAIKVDSFGSKTFPGKVESLMAGTGSAFSLLPPQNATGNYVKVVQRVPVRIALDNGADPDHSLRIGMSVVPTVLVGK